MDSELISVIIPAYNAADTISQCIDSVITQSYCNMEIIVVDDGSEDETGAIVQEYCNKHDNLILIDQKNSGAGSAQNMGLQVASGKYVQFVDSDDILMPNATQILYNAINEAESDLVICGAQNSGGGGDITTIATSLRGKQQITSYFDTMLSNGSFVPLWNKLYKREICNNLVFEDIKVGEDLLFNIEYVDRCNSLKIIPDILYQRKISDGSVSVKYHDTYMEDVLSTYKRAKLFLVRGVPGF